MTEAGSHQLTLFCSRERQASASSVRLLSITLSSTMDWLEVATETLMGSPGEAFDWLNDTAT